MAILFRINILFRTAELINDRILSIFLLCIKACFVCFILPCRYKPLQVFCTAWNTLWSGTSESLVWWFEWMISIMHVNGPSALRAASFAMVARIRSSSSWRILATFSFRWLSSSKYDFLLLRMDSPTLSKAYGSDHRFEMIFIGLRYCAIFILQRKLLNSHVGWLTFRSFSTRSRFRVSASTFIWRIWGRMLGDSRNEQRICFNALSALVQSECCIGHVQSFSSRFFERHDQQFS